MKTAPNNTEKTFPTEQLLVTKTDTKGIITYTNQNFAHIVGVDEEELIGRPHNIIRHPDTPRIIFKLLWNYLHSQKEIHAYVKNLCADGSYYWVFANVTPSFEETKVIGYHSTRRNPDRNTLKSTIIPLYQTLIQAEKNGGINASEKILNDIMKEKGMEYDEFILSL